MLCCLPLTKRLGGGYGEESEALLTEIRRRDWKVKGIYFYLGPGTDFVCGV